MAEQQSNRPTALVKPEWPQWPRHLAWAWSEYRKQADARPDATSTSVTDA